MLITLNAPTRAIAQEAMGSHDGLAAKYARIILCASECESFEDVASRTGWPLHTVQRVVEKYLTEGDVLLRPRPKPIKPLIKNKFLTTYEGPEWNYYNGALLISSMENSKAVIAEIKRLIPDPHGKRVLDVGAGEGAFAMMLRDLGFVVECIDIEDLRYVPQDIAFTHADIDKGLNCVLSADQYDLVLAVEVVGCLREPFKFFEESFVLLRPGGYFLMTMNNITNFVSRAVFATDGTFMNCPKGETSFDHRPSITILPWFTYEKILKLKRYEQVRTLETDPMSVMCINSWKHFLRSLVRLLTYLLSMKSLSDPRTGKQVLISGMKPAITS